MHRRIGKKSHDKAGKTDSMTGKGKERIE